MQNLKTKIRKLPLNPGIYQFFDKDGQLIYVGKSVSIKKRVASYFASRDLGPKTNQLVTKIADIKYIRVFSEFEALLLESDLINEHKPFYNIQSKDDKSPIYIKITTGEVPLLETIRKTSIAPQKARGEYIKGPFPSAKTTRHILKLIRRIFPYCHHKNAKSPCLYVHLGLCPYPYQSEESKIIYKKAIQKIKDVLTGKSKRLIRQLTSEMTTLAKGEQFEEANKVKKQIQLLEYITSTYHTPREFLETPTLVDDLNLIRLKDLKLKLNLAKLPRRIECYDISNISGKFATGSMVVFQNGKPQKEEYRRFKIKFLNTPNDFEMIREVIARRFKNTWPEADLMIIDGGRGQLSSALEIANKYQKNIPIVGLAKRLEEIYLPNDNIPISLPKESPARQLVQAARDEAHRFAITYHRLLRSKNFLPKDRYGKS